MKEHKRYRDNIVITKIKNEIKAWIYTQNN